jgi:hypothetical protein
MASSALTLLQIINTVLVRLRESTVAAYNTTEYSTQITGVVNQVKTEIEEAYRWDSMRDTYVVTAVSGTTGYGLTSSGMNAEIIAGWNTTTGCKLTLGTNPAFDHYFFGLAAGQTLLTGYVTEYLPAGLDANYDLKVDIYPSPTSNNTLKFQVYRPQNDLAANGDIPLCPQNVLVEETIARMLLERGDDGAAQPDPTSGSGKFVRTDLLAKAVMKAQGEDPSEMDWVPE